jgi:LPXTG-motif cell wall-anchored protein
VTVGNTPLSLGQALAVGSTVATSQGSTATVTEIAYDDSQRTYTILFDHLAVGDSIPLQITYSLFNYDNISKQNLPNDVYLYSQYKLNGTQGALTDTPGGGVGVCHDLDKLNVVCQGSVTLHKQDSEGHPLQGVQFDLYNEQGQKVPFVPQENGEYAATVTKSNGDWISAAASGKTTTTDLVTDSEGNIRLTALPEGSYTLVETKTVSGQQLLAEPVSIVMPYVKSGAQINVDGNVYFDGTNHLYELEYTITNTANFKLPSTGAENLMPVWSMAGFAVLGITVILSRKRKYGQM